MGISITKPTITLQKKRCFRSQSCRKKKEIEVKIEVVTLSTHTIPTQSLSYIQCGISKLTLSSVFIMLACVSGQIYSATAHSPASLTPL